MSGCHWRGITCLDLRSPFPSVQAWRRCSRDQQSWRQSQGQSFRSGWRSVGVSLRLVQSPRPSWGAHVSVGHVSESTQSSRECTPATGAPCEPREGGRVSVSDRPSLWWARLIGLLPGVTGRTAPSLRPPDFPGPACEVCPRFPPLQSLITGIITAGSQSVRAFREFFVGALI